MYQLYCRQCTVRDEGFLILTTMTPNYIICVILFQVSILLSGSQGQYWKNNGDTSALPSTKFIYPNSAYYPPYVPPYQYYGPFGGYPPRPTASSYPPSPFFPAPYSRFPNTSALSEGAQAQQQYFLGPMTISQAKYLMSYIKSLMQYGNNQMSSAQVPSTPVSNASSIQPTPKPLSSTPIPYTPSKPTSVPIIVPLESSTSTPAPISPDPTLAPVIVPLESSSTPASMSPDSTPVPVIVPLESSTPSPSMSSLPTTSAIVLPEVSNVTELTTTPPPPITLEVVLPNNSSETINSTGESSSTRMSPIPKSNDPIVEAMQIQPNPFSPNTMYGADSWLYNPAVSSFYGNVPLDGPFYPPGFGPRNPFVFNSRILPMPQSNQTQQEAPTSPQSDQENSTETSSASPAAEGGFTNMEDLPPQVKEFIDMIPDILAMPESSQLNPSNGNAIIHQLTGGLPNIEELGVHQFEGGSSIITPKPKSYVRKPKNSLRHKKRRFKSLRNMRKIKQ